MRNRNAVFRVLSGLEEVDNQIFDWQICLESIRPARSEPLIH